ncbi:type II toxin-antitoxin system RelE/ParE family toxin [Thiomicrorhabdus sp. Kp2]|uniref:type II toxin-antitoxin system RelE/ParE family toxin n=1 Tax=Thiomicrorhabdus sp. Kp2 TaxID=1123518 RepID=UPI00040D1599|nr:type II toxin-antitoxin system RelE/ParE family toxin [Thiomicrorhabdus sp. Kp2]
MGNQNSLKLVVAPVAQSDIFGIFNYTLENWGEKQAQNYLMILKKALQALRERPLKGKVRPDLNSNIRSIIVEKHIVYYRQQEKVLEIVRILHGRQDPDVRVSENL